MEKKNAAGVHGERSLRRAREGEGRREERESARREGVKAIEGARSARGMELDRKREPTDHRTGWKYPVKEMWEERGERERERGSEGWREGGGAERERQGEEERESRA